MARGIIVIDHVRETEFLGVDEASGVRSETPRREMQPADPHLLVLGAWAESVHQGVAS